MKKLLFLGALLLSTVCMNAQTSEYYQEAANPIATNPALWAKVTAPQISWGSTDIRYKKEEPAPIHSAQKSMNLTAWKGEKISAQLVVWTPKALNDLTFMVSDLTSGSATISKENIRTGFVRYVITDELNKDGLGACGYRNSADFDSTLVADVIDHITPTLTLPANSTQGGWISVNIPQGTKAGKYTGTVTVKADGITLSELKLNLQVKNRTLPPPSEWAFHLDLWQNPYAVSRYYNVEPFSKKHFDLMRPLMKLYADAGGKVITASIMHKPWNGQTYDAFESMVTWLKKADGTWYFDYTVFDKWVEFMMDLGVKKQISCYSMVPWRLSFQYFDQASNSFKFLDAKPGEVAYEEFWMNMLQDFSKHLKAKGWFDITHIAMDERPMKDMQETLKVIRKADKDFKVSLAGTYHKELLDDLNDYCITIAEKFAPEEIEARRKAGKVTTYYTCCTEPRPNTFTFSEPAEAEWLAWHSAKENLDGYLRWAFGFDPILNIINGNAARGHHNRIRNRAVNILNKRGSGNIAGENFKHIRTAFLCGNSLCGCINTGHRGDSVAIAAFNRFRVKIRGNDIFGTCQNCNSCRGCIHNRACADYNFAVIILSLHCLYKLIRMRHGEGELNSGNAALNAGIGDFFRLLD